MEFLPRDDSTSGQGGSGNAGHEHDPAEWAEMLARTVAHLAAQLTVAQLQLRALGEEVAARDLVDREAVTARMRPLAAAQLGPALRENLGEALSEVVDVEALERDLLEYLTSHER